MFDAYSRDVCVAFHIVVSQYPRQLLNAQGPADTRTVCDHNNPAESSFPKTETLPLAIPTFPTSPGHPEHNPTYPETSKTSIQKSSFESNYLNPGYTEPWP